MSRLAIGVEEENPFLFAVLGVLADGNDLTLRGFTGTAGALARIGVDAGEGARGPRMDSGLSEEGSVAGAPSLEDDPVLWALLGLVRLQGLVRGAVPPGTILPAPTSRPDAGGPAENLLR